MAVNALIFTLTTGASLEDHLAQIWVDVYPIKTRGVE